MSADTKHSEPIQWVLLREVAHVVMGQSPPSSSYNTSGNGLPFFQGKSEFGPMYPTKVKWCSSPGKLAEPEDVLISVRAPVGPTNIAAESCCIGRGLAAIRVNPGVRSKWLLYALRSIEKSIDELGTGTTFRAISGGTLRQLKVPIADLAYQDRVVAEIEKQSSRLDEAVANLKQVKAKLKRLEKATIEKMTDACSFRPAISGSISDVAISLDNMRKPVNKLERAKRRGTIPYLGANGRTGWIDVPLFDEELVLVVEDETFVGRTAPFSYYFSAKCWVNNHTHVLRARQELVLPKYLNFALSYYPFIPLTTGSTGRRKLTKAALMSAPISVPSIAQQRDIIAEVERCLSLVHEVETEVDANLKRAQALRQGILRTAFFGARSAGQ